MKICGKLFCCLTVLTQFCTLRRPVYFCLGAKFILLAPQKEFWEVYVRVQSFFNSALCGVEWLLLDAPAAFRPR